MNLKFLVIMSLFSFSLLAAPKHEKTINDVAQKYSELYKFYPENYIIVKDVKEFSKIMIQSYNETKVVVFYAPWNKNIDQFILEILSLKNCKIIFANIELIKPVLEDYEIKITPTILLYKEDRIERFEANIKFELDIDIEELQTIIDE